MQPEVVELQHKLPKRQWPPWGPIPPWDPIPDWFQFDQKHWQKFAELEIRFKIRELEIQKQKLEQISQLPIELLRKIVWPEHWPPFDPIPDWAQLVDEHFQRFAHLEFMYRLQELDIELEKLEQFQGMLG